MPHQSLLAETWFKKYYQHLSTSENFPIKYV